jgi:AcrR family transcriptional regulator
MTAAERRASILDAAMHVFSNGSYASATTASIAREAGITEPVLYHHFKGKADLYGACLDQAWTDLRARWNAIVESQPADRWVQGLAEAGFAALEDERDASRLWLYAITDLAEDDKVRPRVIEFTRDLHAYVVDVLRRAQEAGGIAPQLDPQSEAWMFLSIGILRALSRRLDGVADRDFPALLQMRQSWYEHGAAPGVLAG